MVHGPEACAMNQLLAYQIKEIVRPCIGLGCEDSLRVAAETLAHAGPDDVSATTVAVRIGQDDPCSIEALVADIADEFGVDYRVRHHATSFSVRFCRSADEER
jgi:hypothetical protein